MGPRIALLCLALPFSFALAQSSAPPRRAHHALAYDETSKRVIMTGGSTPTNGGQSSVFFNDLWAFDGTRWSALPSSGSLMSGIAIAYDAQRKRLTSFGGYDGSSRGDVRVLENTAWKTIGQLTEMPAAEPGFVYDAKRERFVAFGGSAGPGRPHSDTWEFDGTTWTKVAAVGPASRQGHVMVYDVRRDRTVLFGGMGVGAPGQQPPSLGDTWEFDGKQWTQRQVAGPSPRFGAGSAYDSKRGRVIVFGGLGANGFNAETWAWDGTSWTKLSDKGPEARGMGYLAYDKQRDRVVMFGGRKGYPNGDMNDTWEWDGVAWKQIN